MPSRRQQGPDDLTSPGLSGSKSSKASNDRLSSTLFLAGLLHGVILLGVTFTADSLPPASAATSLEVVLITNDYEKRAAPEDAEILAQQNMVGAGNTDEPMQLSTALHQILETGAIGPEQIGSPNPRREGSDRPTQRPTIVAKSLTSHVGIPENYTENARIETPEQKTLPGTSHAIEIINKPEAETLISGFQPRELIISANTREARIAAYLGQWKNKVERVGTLNYPNVARSKGLARFPTLEVVINAKGELREIVLRSSSGEQSLDRAAMDIVSMAAPFDPFPEFLRSEYDVLRFAYEWRFTGAYVSNTVNPVSTF